MKRFHDIRIKALKDWIIFTNRKPFSEFENHSTENYSESFECKWQSQSNEGHVNLFCSFGEWSCNITDVLRDSQFDHLDFDDREEARVLFRHYTRFMLVVSEMLTDFQDIYLQSKNLENNGKNKNFASKFYFPFQDPNPMAETLGYINVVCKHKTQHLHVCNNHSEINFEDSLINSFNYIRIGDSTADKDKDAILIPKLEFLTGTIINCYNQLDGYFLEDRIAFENICKKYS